ncbi:hypothetical protein [Paenibacillus sp. sgz500958]|uniref:hypothetical protein n=1 Tax=Paenibacillus sp. sgz500958 TaxID=3242475 RepID=UPI0036D3DE44
MTYSQYLGRYGNSSEIFNLEHQIEAAKEELERAVRKGDPSLVEAVRLRITQLEDELDKLGD